MKTAARIAILLPLVVCGGASAQRIEISSESIGTVVVTPPAVERSGNAARTATVPRARNSQRTGVDLGIQRRRDGSLYDALDPAQNPAAATPPSLTDRNAPASANAAAPAATGNNANAAAGGLSGMGAPNAAPGTTLPANGYGTGATMTTANPALTGASDVSSSPGATGNAANSAGTGGAAGTGGGGTAGGGAARGR